MAEPKLTPRYANRLKPEPPATNQTEQAWRTMQSRGYWESPMRVARYYNVIRTAPPGWKAPEWLDVDAVNTAYAYMRERNGNKPYTEWSYLPYNDPGSAYLRSLSAPPENMLWPNEVGDIKNRNRWPMELRSLLPDKNPPAILPGAEDAGPMTPEQIAEQQPYGDWNDLKLWQQIALGALSPQAPLEDRPEWTRWTAAGFQGALAGLGGAYLGSVAGPVGALAGFLTVGGLAAWQAFSGEKIPVVGDALMLLDQPALFLEKTIGVGEQLSAEGWKKVISELPEAYQAGAFSYESGAFSTPVLNALAVIGGDQPAAPGEVWMLEQGLTEPQKAGEAVGPEALARYRRMLLEGASMDDLYADAQENYGFSGTAADFLFQSVLDPLNLAPYAGGKLGAKVAEAAGNKRLANAFEMGVGNPLIDILPPGIQGLTSKITGIQGSQGPLQSFNTYKDWVRQGTFQAGVERVLPGDLSAYEKRVAGLTAEGKIKEVQPRAVMPGKKSLGTLFNYLTTLDDASRAHVFLNILHNNLNAMLTLSEGKPADMVTTLKKITGKAQFAKDDPVMELMASPAMATIQNALRAAVDSGVADEMLASWEATAQNRIILAKISQALNMQPGKVLELLQSKPDHLTALLNEKAPMVGRPEDLKQLLGAFVGDDALPWNANKFQAQLVIELANKTDQWVINAYGLKPDSAVVRLSQLLKSAQSFLLLSFNPGYFVNNELNNMVTRAAEGVWGYMTPKEIGTFMDRFGLTPARMDVGIGAAETGAFEGGLQAIGKAKQSKDALAVAQRIIGNTTDKVGLFSKLSSEFEKRESRQTTVISMKRFWKKYWKRGRGLRRMPPAIESLLDARYPGMKEVVYAAAEAGMSMDEIQNGLYSGVVRPAVSEVIDTISRQISPDNPERITDLMAHLGIDQKLEESLANSTTPDQVDVAFNEIEKQMQGWVDEKVAAGLQTRAEDVRNKIKAERIPALLRIFGDMEIEWGKRWVDGRLEWEDLYARKDQGEFQDAAAWQQAVEALNAKQDADWHNIQKWVTQTYKGIIEALGLEDPRGQKFLKEIDTIFEDWHKFYEIRKKKFADYRRSTAKKSGETWEQVNARKSIAWAKLQDELMDLYDQHTKKERTAQRNMDNLFATMFAEYTGWDTTAAKRWREQIDEMRATLVAMQTEFRKQVRDMLPEDRDAAYLEFNKEYNALVAKMKQLEQQGAFEVARQTTPPAQPQGEPGPQPSPEPTAPTQPTQPTQPADIRDGLTPEQRQQYDDLLAKGVPADLISVDEQGNVTAPEPVSSRSGPLLVEAEKYGIPTRTKAGDPMERVALNVINKYSGQKFNNLGDVPPDVATAAYKKHQEAHLGEQAKASAKLVIDAQEIVDMADAQAREARVKQMGALTRRAVRESLLSVLGDDELAAEATLTLMDSHADVWAKNKGWAPGEAARDAWYATHIAKILRGDESAPGSTMNGLEQLPALEGARIRLQRATEAYDAYAKSNDLIEGRSFQSWETWYRTIKGLDRSIPMDVWNVIYELDNAKFDLDMLSWLNANNKEWSGRSMFEYLDYQRNVQYSNVRYQEVNGQHQVSWDANGSPMQPRLFDNAESAHRFAEGLENGQYLYQQSLEYQAIRVAWERPEPTPIDTPEFRAFFGNSHVIDVDGVPREVYHGTSHGEFDTLSENLVGKNYHAGYRGTGYYFSSSLGTGEYYTGVGGGGQPTLYKVYLSIQRPYYWEAGSVYDHYYGDLPLPNDIRAEVERVSGIKFGSGQSANPENARSDMRILADAIQAVIKAKGHDGIIYNTGKVTEYVVFDPGQAKSIYNRGTWDRRNPNMLMQEQQRWYYSQLQRVIEAKMPNKASAQQIRGMLQGVVKADEMQSTGFNDFLAENPNPTKQQVMDFLQENQVEVKEVVSGDDMAGTRATQERDAAISSLENEYKNAGMYIDEQEIVESMLANRRPPEWIALPENIKTAWNNLFEAHKRIGKVKEPKFSQYVLHGGENYRELLLTLPQDDYRTRNNAAETLYHAPYAQLTASQRESIETIFQAGRWDYAYRGSHWEEANVLAHTRFDDRIDADGKRVLFIEEIQSDWHQQGREQGYSKSPITIDSLKAEFQKLNEQFEAIERADPRLAELITQREQYSKQRDAIPWGEPGSREIYLKTGNELDRIDRERSALIRTNQELQDILEKQRTLSDQIAAGQTPVPAAPFSKSWEELTIKRIIRWAAENGYERVAWTTGKMQADRYPVDIIWKPSTSKKGWWTVSGKSRGTSLFPDTEVKTIDHLRKLPGEAGTKWVDKIWAAIQAKQEGGELQPLLSGMEEFYDVKIPNIVNKYVKKWGAKVGETNIGKRNKVVEIEPGEFVIDGTRNPIFDSAKEALDYEANVVQSFDVTPAMRESVMQGQPLFQRAKGSYELLPDGRAVIRAFNAADVSTIVHEIGHVFRRDLGDADMDAVAKLGGLSGAAELRLLESRFASGTLKQGDADYSRYVAAEEAFARGWEAYLAEGRAPTPQLRSVFRRFTNWLLGIYKNLKRFMGRTTGFEQQPELAKVNLNAEINGISLRDIFDRLLADERKQPADFYDLVYKRADALQKEGRNYRFTKDQLNIRARREIIGELFADFKSLDEAIAKADELDADLDGGVILSGDGTPIDSATLWEAIQTVKAYPEIAPWAEIAQVRGTKTVARGIADPNNQYEFQFKVMDLNDLQASDLWEGEKIVPNPNYPQELQPRIRGKKQSVANTDDRARNLVPAELLFDAQALDRGAPIVGPDNFVESGNGRVLSLMRAASTYPEMYDSYRQALLAILPQYGIDPASIEGMERPVLVRERLTEVDRAAFASDANKPIAEKMDPAEVALNDARLISDQSLINLEVGDNETIEAALQSSRNNAFVQSWLKQLSTNELAELSKNGQINSVGIQRLIHALFAKVYKGVEGERLLNAFTMSMDSGVKNAQSAIMASLPQMARMEGMIAAGVRSAGLSLAGDVAVAVDKMASIRASGKMTVTEYLSSAPMFGEEMTPVQRGLLEFFAQQKQPKRIREMLREYALQVIDHEPDPNQMGLFGDVAGRTKEDLLNAAIRQLEPEAPEGSLFAAQPEPTAAVEPAPVAVEPEPGAETTPATMPATTPATTNNAEKAPWQMTAEEFTARFESSIDPNKHDFGGLTKKQYVQMMSRAGRHNAVYQALLDGKAVPPEVLADFPGLPEEAAKAKGSWAAVQKPTAARVQTRAEQIRLVMKDITEGRPSFKVALEYGLSGDKNYPLRQELAKIVFGVEDYNDPISVNTLVHEMFRAAGLDTMYLTEDRAWKAFEKWVNGEEIAQEAAQVKTTQPAVPPAQKARRVRSEQIVQDFEAGKPVKLDELQDADDSGMLNLDDIIRGIQEQEGGNEGQESNARPGGSLLQEAIPERNAVLGERRPGGAVRPADTRRPSDTVARNLHEEQGQVTDLSHILTAFDAGHRGYVLANGTGTGKTYVALGLLAEIKPKRALIVVPNANIGTQWADASGKFGVAISKLDQSDAGDGIFTTTYTDLTARYKRKELSALIGKKWDLVIFDESHKLKNYDGSDSTQQAYVGVQIAKVADRSLYMSATPYQGLTEMRYLESLGLWQEGEYESFLAEHGYEYMQLPTGDGYWRFAGDPAQLVDVQKRMIEMGVFSQRDLLLQGVKLDNNFLRVNLNGYEESYRRANMIFDRYKEYAYTPRQRALIESQRTLVLRRIMELSKTKEAIRAAQEHLASGRQVAIFVGFRSDLRAPELKKFPGLTRDVDALYASLGEDGNIKQIVDALGGPSKVAQVHGGAGGDAAIDADIKAYQRGYKRVLVATAAKGGTGLSLHDTMGNAPRTQINVYLPWNGQEYQQVSGRSYRTGSKSDVIQVWLFSDAGKEATIAATVGGRLKEMGAVVRGIEADADAGRIAAFEMDMLDDPHIEAAFAKKLRVPGDGIYAVRTEPFEYGGQTIVSRVYVNGQHVAYLPEGMKTAQTFETRAGKARVLGLDVKNPSQWVYVIIDTGQLGKFDPKRPALQQAGPSLFQEDANPMGDVPLGSVPEPMNEGMAADEVHSELLRPAMRKMRQEFKRKMGERPLEVGGADDETQKLIRAYLKQVNVDMASAKLATMNYGMQMRDAALLNYSRRFGADTILQMIFPYEFWYTRTFMNWARRMIDKPTWWATYARYRQAQEKMERDGMPQRLQGKVRIPMPFLDDWMGGGLWIDPLRQAFPPDSFFQPMEQFMNDQAQVQRAAEAALGEMLRNGEITQADFNAAVETRSGTYWELARKQAEFENNKDSSAAGLVSTMMQPALWWTIPSALIKGKPETINPLPITRTASSIETALAGTPLETVGKAVGLAAWPERTIRKAAGLSEFGQWGDYYVERQIANMAADGTVTPEQANIAMVEKGQNPVYQQAFQRVQQEMMLRTQGAQALSKLARGDLKGAWGSLPQLFFSGGLFPEGELKLRGLKPEYDNAWRKYNAGDTEAINQFFEDHPEYETRLALYDEPSERLRQFLISEVWDRYSALSKANKTKAVNALGQDFVDTFLDKNTRSYDAITVDTLARWSWTLGGAVPKTGETETLAQPEPMEIYPPEVSAAVDAYHAERDSRFQDVLPLQEIYYALPKAQRTAYLNSVPRLRKYWEWNRQYKADHPDLAPYLQDQQEQMDQETMSEFNDSLLRQLVAHYLGGQPLSSGARADLRRIWQKSGEPGASFEDWVEGAVRSTFVGQ